MRCFASLPDVILFLQGVHGWTISHFVNIYTGQVSKAPPSSFVSERRDGSRIVFPPEGNDSIVCGHYHKTIEQNIRMETSAPQRFPYCFCKAINFLPAHVQPDAENVESRRRGCAAVLRRTRPTATGQHP